jgi:outer membrane protein assembly factor BamA
LKKFKHFVFFVLIFGYFKAFPQQAPLVNVGQNAKVNKPGSPIVDSANQRDLIDILQKVLDKNTSGKNREKARKANFSVIPYSGYTLSTGFTANITGNVGFYTDAGHRQNLSVIAVDIGYDTKIQKTIRSRAEIWGNDNNYKFVTDIRYEIYPTDTYGLGTFTTLASDNNIYYRYARVYLTVFKKITGNYYAGIGYNLDHHFDITATGNADGSASDFIKYGQTTQSTSSGFNLDFLFDSRKNPINPLSGSFASLVFRQNLTLPGSNANWESVQVDFRKYIKLSPGSNNVLAIWTIAAFTRGDVPYLDLPSTGSDMYNNAGRGYAIGRFRGRNELYLEGEYRFGITRNGLLGAVLFANGESFSELQTNRFESVAPAVGTGIRIKINKHSGSNICIDYGVGTDGSHGFFVNLGEVF